MKQPLRWTLSLPLHSSLFGFNHCVAVFLPSENLSCPQGEQKSPAFNRANNLTNLSVLHPDRSVSQIDTYTAATHLPNTHPGDKNERFRWRERQKAGDWPSEWQTALSEWALVVVTSIRTLEQTKAGLWESSINLLTVDFTLFVPHSA